MANCPKCGCQTTVWNRDILSGFCSRCLIQAPTVRLGCGSLISIFVIVIIALVWHEDEKKDKSHQATRNQLQELQKEVESVEITLRKLQSAVDKLRESLAPAPPADVSRDPIAPETDAEPETPDPTPPEGE